MSVRFAFNFLDMKILRLSIVFLALISCFAANAQTGGDSVNISRSHQVADSILRAINGRPNLSTTQPVNTAVGVVDSLSNKPAVKQSLQAVDSAVKAVPQQAPNVPVANPAATARPKADSTIRQQRPKTDGSMGAVPQARPAIGGAPAGGPPSGMAGMQSMRMNIGHVYGKVIDGQNKKPMSYTSVSLYTMKDSLITGQLTEDNGDFSFTELPMGAYNVKVTFLGYKDLVTKVVLMPGKSEQDIGNLTISPDAKQLKEVDVTAQRSTVELKVDRKVFNVGNDISARGGTGLDVMKNIPSVSIDASGNVTLRNNTPQVYVDGKPTTLTLEQIPADQIDRVEVITNPSAKFEAASSGGIINVVMKRNTKPGYNGMINLGVGTNNQYNGLALLNLKQKKFGVNLMYTINSAINRTYGYSNRANLDSMNREMNFNNQGINSYFKRIFQVAKVGFDFYISNRNTLSISENAVFGNFNTTDDISAVGQDSAHNTLSRGSQVNDQKNYFRNFTTDINFKHTYPKEGKEYTIDVQYNYSKGGGNYLYTSNNYSLGGSLLPNNPYYQASDGGQHAHMITAQWDLSLPLGKNMKIETGLRSNYKLTYSYLNVNNGTTDSLGDVHYIRNTDLSNNYRIDDLVNAAYITFTHQVKSFSYQLGLRAEEVFYKGTLLSSGDSSFSYQYPTNAASIPKILFPSFNLSQKWGTAHELQFNAARKSNRPNFFQIAPFIFYSDVYNVRIGNPQLQPEFINQGEVNYNLATSKVSWLSSVYGRYIQQPITSFIYPEAHNPSVFINTFANADHSLNGGWENTIKIFPIKKLDITLSGNVFYTDIVGGSNVNNTNNSGWSWLAKAMVSYKLPFDITIQANGAYEAPKIIPQGKTMEMYYFDISLSKDFGFVTLNFTISDVLNSRTNGIHYYQSSDALSNGFVEDISRRRDQRFAKLGVSFRFGKMDASLFKKKRPSAPDQGGDMGF